MEQSTPPEPVPQPQPSTPPPSSTANHSHSSKKKWLFILGGILLLLLVGISAYTFGLSQNRQPEKLTQQSVPSPLPSSVPKTSDVLESKPGLSLYAENGFSFSYPRNLQLNQELVDGALWQSEHTPGEYIQASLILRRFDKPFSRVVSGASFPLYKTKYPYEPTQVNVEKLEESNVPLGSKMTTMYTISCGVDCYYHVVRFESNKTYYELIANGAGGGLLNRFQTILASFSFYDANGKEWKKYINSQGKYSVQFPPNSSLFENTYLSTDGVRVFEENMITIYPAKPVNIDKIFTIRYKPAGSMTLDAFVREKQGSTVVSGDETKTITVAGEPAIYKTMPGLLPIPTIFVKHNDIIYTIGGTSPEDPILSTFKFL